MSVSFDAARLVKAGAGILVLSVLLLGCERKGASPEASTPQKPSKPDTTVPAPEKALSEFAVRPPEVLDIQVTPLGDMDKDNALLEIRFAPDKRLGDAVEINIADRPVQFRRSAEQPEVFSATVTMDLKTLRNDIAEAQRMAERNPQVLRFKDRMLESKVDVRRTSSLSRGEEVLVRAKAFRFGIDLSRLGAFLVDPARELLVTSTSVVEDPARTFDPCTGAGTPGGAWTFGKLMRDMANQPSSGVAAEDFVSNWITSWNSQQATATFAVPGRPAVQSIIDHWPKLANGKLDLDKAPFRLLAIVNRLDLRTGSAYASGDAGEGRFVFGLVDQSSTGTCAGGSTRPFTVIFEYKVPISGCNAVHSYAAQWRALGDIALGDAAFNPALQAVTDQFTAANAAPGKPNGSAIGQIRTNENALDPIWELREFHLLADHQLHTVSPVQVPQSTLNQSVSLEQFINGNLAGLAVGAVDIPPTFNGQPFQAGSSLNPLPLIAWRGTSISPATTNERFHLSLGTCNSCHGREVQNPLSLSRDSFLQIRPRAAGAEATLATFLIGDGSLASPSTHAFVDPFLPGVTRNIGDLVDRQGKLAGASGKCLSIGLIEEIRFQPLRFVH